MSAISTRLLKKDKANVIKQIVAQKGDIIIIQTGVTRGNLKEMSRNKYVHTI